MMRLDPETPCNRALTIYRTHNGKLKRGNHSTWINQMNRDLKSVGVVGVDGTIWDTGVRTLAQERDKWRRLVTSSTRCDVSKDTVEQR